MVAVGPLSSPSPPQPAATSSVATITQAAGRRTGQKVRKCTKGRKTQFLIEMWTLPGLMAPEMPTTRGKSGGAGGLGLEDLGDALLEGGPGLPAEVDLGPAGIERHAVDLVRAPLAGLRAHVNTRRLGHGFQHVPYRRLDAAPDVEEEAGPPVGRSHEGVDHVVDIDEVARLGAVTPHDDRQAVEQRLGEGTDDTRRRLPR